MACSIVPAGILITRKEKKSERADSTVPASSLPRLSAKRCLHRSFRKETAAIETDLAVIPTHQHASGAGQRAKVKSNSARRYFRRAFALRLQRLGLKESVNLRRLAVQFHRLAEP